tara:strand:- start:136 stop:510 length:375 start_codon:yes stop_codon:yes gene_type:complete
MIDTKISGIAELVFRGVRVSKTLTKAERTSLFLNFFLQINYRTPMTLEVSMDLKHHAILLVVARVPVFGIQIEEDCSVQFFPFGKMSYEDWANIYLNQIWMQKAIGSCLMAMQEYGDVEQLPLD